MRSKASSTSKNHLPELPDEDEDRASEGIRKTVIKIARREAIRLSDLQDEGAAIEQSKLDWLVDLPKKLELNFRRDGEGRPDLPLYLSADQLEILGAKLAGARVGRPKNGNGNGNGNGHKEAAH